MPINNSIKSTFIVLTLISSSAVSAASFIPASTDTDYNYAGIKAGGVLPGDIQGNTDLQNSSGNKAYTAGMFVGRKIQDRFAVELEYMNRGNSDINSSYSGANARDSWSVKADTFMLNMVVDVMTDTKVRPYFKIGLGASVNKSNPYVSYNNGTTQTWGGKTVTKFAWQVGLGVDMPVNKTISTIFAYSYVNRGKFKTQNGYSEIDGLGSSYTKGSPQTGKLRDQSLTVGLKFKF
jgi:opacity protein-like surface antigen